MNVLITGAAGFIGSHLVQRLLELGHSVTGLVRDGQNASALTARRLLALHDLRQRHSNLALHTWPSSENKLAGVLAAIQPEVCVHLAGRSWVRESLEKPALYEQANYRTTLLLLEGLRLCKCRRVVFASSVMVYGADAAIPYREDALGRAPASPYGATKLACEILMNTYRLLHKLDTVNLRLFSVYGPDLRPDTVPYLMANAVLKNKPFTIFGDGHSVRDYVEIADVLDALVAACQSGNAPAALNIGSGAGTPLIELLRQIERALGKPATVVYRPAITGELAVAIPDISLAAATLDWHPKVTLEKGIERLARWAVEYC